MNQQIGNKLPLFFNRCSAQEAIHPDFAAATSSTATYLDIRSVSCLKVLKRFSSSRSANSFDLLFGTRTEVGIVRQHCYPMTSQGCMQLTPACPAMSQDLIAYLLALVPGP